jgi:hypothetical protein
LDLNKTAEPKKRQSMVKPTEYGKTNRAKKNNKISRRLADGMPLPK